jgi:anti-sigma factor RsiW
MNGPESNPQWEAGLRQEITARELAQVEAFLTAHPEERACWEEDLALNGLLRQLRDRPLASNFTAQVIQAVARDAQSESLRRFVRGCDWLGARHWIPRAALAGLLLSLGWFTFYLYQRHTRAELAQNVAKVSEVTTLVSVEMLQDFDVIHRLSQVPTQVDEELLMALK